MNYLSVAIEDGVEFLILRCPEPRCNALVDRDSIDLFVKKEDKERYSQYLLRSYIESNKKYKWCLGANCEYGVEFCEEVTKSTMVFVAIVAIAFVGIVWMMRIGWWIVRLWLSGN